MAKRNFVSPIDTGNIEFIRPSKLEKPGVIVEATYVESLPNAFDSSSSLMRVIYSLTSSFKPLMRSS